MNHFDPLDLRGQEKKAREADEQARFEATRDADDLKWIMGNKKGRRFVWKLLERSGVYRSSFTGNSTTFFNEGQRNIGLMLLADIHSVCPEHYVTMLKEAKDGNFDDASRITK